MGSPNSDHSQTQAAADPAAAREQSALWLELRQVFSGWSDLSGTARLSQRFSAFLCRGLGAELCADTLRVATQGLRAGELSAEDGAGCILDYPRTWRFSRAVAEAVQAALLQKEQVEVVDAGCGPLCLFGLIAASISPKVNVTAFETNPISAGIAERVAMRFGFANQIRVLRSDAASVQLDRPADIFVSETFDSGLMYESAAQIFRNLLPQLAVDARVIPTRLELNAKLAPYLSGSTADVSEADWSNICRFNLSRASIPATELAGSVSAAGLQPGKYQLLFSTALGFGGGISDLRYPIASPIVSPSARGVIRLDRALDHIDFSFTAGKLGLKLHTEGVELVSIRNIFEL